MIISFILIIFLNQSILNHNYNQLFHNDFKINLFIIIIISKLDFWL